MSGIDRDWSKPAAMASPKDGYFELEMRQNGLLRPLKTSELSDGTLRYLLLVAALLSPRPPALMILNEPETSLHPELLPALARLIAKASRRSQVVVVSHAPALVAALDGVARICTNLPADCFLASMFAEGTPVLANDFSQSCEDGPRMFPSMNASPGHRVQLPTWEQEVQVVRSFKRIERTSFIRSE